jgi:hypothetical protein
VVLNLPTTCQRQRILFALFGFDGGQVIFGGLRLLWPREHFGKRFFVRKALDICEEGKFTPEELEAYEREWMRVSNEKAMPDASYDEGGAS